MKDEVRASALTSSFYYEEACLAAAGGDVDDGRVREPNHRALDAAAEEERVRVNVHRLEAPSRVSEDGEDFRVKLHGLLPDAVAFERGRQGLVPLRLRRPRANDHASPAVIVVRLEDERLAI